MTRNKFAGWMMAAGLLLALLCVCDVASACPTCKDQLANDPAAANIVRGYFWSILFMVSMPFLILSGLSSYFYYLVWSAQRANAHVAPLRGGHQAAGFQPALGAMPAHR